MNAIPSYVSVISLCVAIAGLVPVLSGLSGRLRRKALQEAIDLWDKAPQHDKATLEPLLTESIDRYVLRYNNRYLGLIYGRLLLVLGIAAVAYFGVQTIRSGGHYLTDRISNQYGVDGLPGWLLILLLVTITATYFAFVNSLVVGAMETPDTQRGWKRTLVGFAAALFIAAVVTLVVFAL